MMRRAKATRSLMMKERGWRWGLMMRMNCSMVRGLPMGSTMRWTMSWVRDSRMVKVRLRNWMMGKAMRNWMSLVTG